MDVYAVILHRFEDLEDFYNDMETPGGNLYIPERIVEVNSRKPTSRSTYYMLTREEADQISDDPRVEVVEKHNPNKYPELHAIYSRVSGQDVDHINWGLELHKANKFVDQSLPYTGKNVDIVILDDDGWQPDHPEFLDDNGNSRVVAYDWYQHAEEIGDTPDIGRTYVYGRDTNGAFHNIHVAGTAAGRTNGWAKDANIYFLGLTFGGNSFLYNVDDEIAFDYIRAFHRNKPVNPVTGRKNPTIVNNSWGYKNVFDAFGGNINPKDVLSMTYHDEVVPPATPLQFLYETWQGIASDNEMVVPWPVDTIHPERNTVKFITTGPDSGTAELLEYTSMQQINFTAAGYTQHTTAPIALPFTISYLGTDYDYINIYSGSYITFGETYYGSASSNAGKPTSPAAPKLLVASNTTNAIVGSLDFRDVDSGNAFWVKESGVSPNRTFTVIYRGFKNYSQRNAYLIGFGVSSHTHVWQAVFYENEPNRIDVTIAKNATISTAGGYTLDEIKSYGCNAVSYPYVNSVTDASIVDAINEGIIVTAAAGNDSQAAYRPGDINYNNSLSGIYTTTYYNRQSTPKSAGANTDSPCIVVGSLSNRFNVTDNINNKSNFSNFGSIDVYAAGSWIQSAVPTGITSIGGYASSTKIKDGFRYVKASGTSMACPQVTGMLACLLERYPDLNQKQAIRLLNVFSLHNEIYTKPLETWDYQLGLESRENRMLYFKNNRAENKPAYPKVHKGRPESGPVYPRRQISIRK